MGIAHPKATDPRGINRFGGGVVGAAVVTGQANTVQTVANAVFGQRPNNVDFVTSVFTVATT